MHDGWREETYRYANFPMPQHSALEATLWLGGTYGLMNHFLCVQMFPSPKLLRPEAEELVSEPSLRLLSL